MSITVTEYGIEWDGPLPKNPDPVGHVSMDRRIPEETLEAVKGHYAGRIVQRTVTTSAWSPAAN